MSRSLAVASLMAVLMLASPGVGAEAPKGKNIGESRFKELCAMCHPDGGNIVNPKKSLRKKDMDAHGVRTEADIIKLMRKPGPGMNAFDQKAVSDSDAKAIAKYILSTFK